ncbi:ferrous iron transport protein A [bacterium]|nr:ferrous iron transport protein A [bacterium]
MDTVSPLALDMLQKGMNFRVTGFDEAADPGMVQRLRAIGFAEGDEVELLARGPIGGAPLSVRLNRTVVALRRYEASLIRVERAR